MPKLFHGSAHRTVKHTVKITRIRAEPPVFVLNVCIAPKHRRGVHPALRVYKVVCAELENIIFNNEILSKIKARAVALDVCGHIFIGALKPAEAVAREAHYIAAVGDIHAF